MRALEAAGIGLHYRVMILLRSVKMACSANNEKGGLWYDPTTPDLGEAA